MSANSKHYGDVLMWVEKVINSCVTREQCDNARKLLFRFNRIYNPEFEPNVRDKEIIYLHRRSAELREQIVAKENNERIDTSSKNHKLDWINEEQNESN